MGHRIDRGDIIDMLEESITRNIPVAIELTDGRKFEDRVTEISKFEGEDHVEFHQHELTPLRHISRTARAVLPEVAHGNAPQRD
jgi:hypothetical protein